MSGLRKLAPGNQEHPGIMLLKSTYYFDILNRLGVDDEYDRRTDRPTDERTDRHSDSKCRTLLRCAEKK